MNDVQSRERAWRCCNIILPNKQTNYIHTYIHTYIHASTYLIIPELKIYKNRSDERSRHLQADHQGNYRGKDLQAADIQVAAVQPNFRLPHIPSTLF